ncbi:hypothetical protein [Amycolatopsis sp. WQ 127309]|uniref:hypothetical protein n=1 Tax=Amycolatopsis sp. WQ 127309 TaxID=2932773 RepID=UPI001FF45332|nr:hypothetical protein [Amycolatopsis sp. WQ 127309]UOZ12004.1 hypothetical protein MUY22_45020 [Amycolatopsis sp. WQ 127309]
MRREFERKDSVHRNPRPGVHTPLDDEALAREFLEAPELPEGVEFSDLDEEARRELRTLPKALAETVGKHLVAAGGLMDSDPEAALEHAKYAKAKASRVPIVREALGLVAYNSGNWAEALSELRAVRRMTRSDDHIAIIADAERALGRPERALDLAKEADTTKLAKATQVELAIVAAGARRDLGQINAAVVSLQGADLKAEKRDPWSARLFYAYADNLVAAERKDEAIRWFLNAAEADADDETDAAERAADLSNEGIEPAKAAKTTEAPKTTESAKTAEAAGTDEPTKATKATEPTKATDAVETTDAAQADEPTKATGAAKTAEVTEAAKATQANESAETADATDPAKAEAADPAKAEADKPAKVEADKPAPAEGDEPGATVESDD